ncbi:hypothetical protein [Pelagibius sp. Alg239-R121]|uniref:hypothetical protein n=1 Tax=Pelagibius sp. Alg239-R121 TaxID=2993448 RepID=UPI0024A637ED|nr:hypothetical protein [Pelagibius sp. Alg239-R121]
MTLTPGSVIKRNWDERLVRILLCDGVEALYEIWWDHLSCWEFSKLSEKGAYSRIKTSDLLEDSEILRVEPLTTEEISAHRPDLPLRLLRSTQTHWVHGHFDDPAALVGSLSEQPSDIGLSSNEIILSTHKVALSPVGPEGGYKKGVIVEAQDVAGFTAKELFWHANRLQTPFVKQEDLQEGIGLYRSGIFKKLPSFYLWGALDRARFCDPLPGYRSNREGLFWERGNR